MIRAAAFSIALLLTSVAAASGTLSDADLIAYAQTYKPKNWPAAPNGVVGIHHGAEVVVLRSCSDLCPDYLMFVIHYRVDPGPRCEALGGKTEQVMVPVSIAVAPTSFCVPGVLADRKLYTGHWMR